MMKEQGDGPSSNSGGNGNAGKFSLFTAGLHNKILLETEQQHNQNLSPSKQISARSKLSTHPPNNPATHQSGQSKQKPKRPSSANPRVRSSHQHRDPGKPHKNHPILNNPNHNQQPPPKNKEEFYEGRNFAVLNREELLETLNEVKKQQRNNEILIAQLRADNQRLEGEVLKQQHRIDKLLSPQYSKNNHLVLEMRKEIEKSVLVRQLKAQMLSLRATISEKDQIIESLQKKTGSAHLIELSAEKEEYFQEIQRLKKMIVQKDKELQQERNANAWQKKGENVTLEDSLKAEITRLSRGYQQVLEKLENTAAATNASKHAQSRHDDSEVQNSTKPTSRPSSGKSKGSQTRPKSAGSKSSTDRSKVTNALDYIDPILTTFDTKPPVSASKVAPSLLSNNVTTSKPNESLRKEPDFLYEMSEENITGIGGESSVEAYIVTNQGLNLPSTASLPMGCLIQVEKPAGIFLDGRICGYNQLKKTYDVQYEDGGREFDVSRSNITVKGEKNSQSEPEFSQSKPSPRQQQLSTHGIAPVVTQSGRNNFSIFVKSISAKDLRGGILTDDIDPYATLAFDSWMMTTNVQDNRKSQVIWEYSPSERLKFDVDTEKLQKIPLKMTMMDKNFAQKDRLIGSGEILLQSLSQSPFGTEVCLTIPLHDDKGRLGGTGNVVLIPSTQQIERLSSPNTTKKETTVNSKFLIGDDIEGNYQRGGSWYPGVIIAVNGNKYRIRYRDGDEEANVLEENIRFPPNKSQPSDNSRKNSFSESSKPNSTPMYLPNDCVECRLDGLTKIGIIQSVNMDGTYDIKFLGEYHSERKIPNSSILRITQQPSQQQESSSTSIPVDQNEKENEMIPTPLYAIGNKVEVNYRSRGKWFSGTITGVNNHGESYKVDYDDGESEMFVISSNIRLKEIVGTYNIDSLLNDDDDEGEDGIAGGLTTNDLLNDDQYFQQLQNQNNEIIGGVSHTTTTTVTPTATSSNSALINDENQRKSNEIIYKQPSVDINTFLAGLSDDDGDGDDVIGGNLDGGDSINLDYGICAPEGEGHDGDDMLNQTNDYGEDFDD